MVLFDEHVFDKVVNFFFSGYEVTEYGLVCKHTGTNLSVA